MVNVVTPDLLRVFVYIVLFTFINIPVDENGRR
jgi:hypothetical protein